MIFDEILQLHRSFFRIFFIAIRRTDEPLERDAAIRFICTLYLIPAFSEMDEFRSVLAIDKFLCASIGARIILDFRRSERANLYLISRYIFFISITIRIYGVNTVKRQLDVIRIIQTAENRIVAADRLTERFRGTVRHTIRVRMNFA